MVNKYKVRIMRSEIRNIKNVAYGDVMYIPNFQYILLLNQIKMLKQPIKSTKLLIIWAVSDIIIE